LNENQVNGKYLSEILAPSQADGMREKLCFFSESKLTANKPNVFNHSKT